MLLSRKSQIKLNNDESNIVGHMCYAAYKLWNVCNYERLHHEELNLDVEYPDWYYQKKAHKNDLWFKQLPSQTAQEVCKLLDKSWKSFFSLKKTGGIENPKLPHFKHDVIPITYMQKGIVHEPESNTVRLTLSKQLKGYMSETYDIHDNYLYLKNVIFKDMDNIKQIRIYPPANGLSDIIVIYEIPDVKQLPDNGRYLGIDPGLHNLLTCYNPLNGETFIIGRRYLSICHYYDKEIARVQSQWAKTQYNSGIKYPKPSKHVLRLYERKKNAVKDYLHKVTKRVVEYCCQNHINTVVIGDLTGIRKDNDKGDQTNQQLHAWPYAKIYVMLSYKLALNGIKFVMQKECYSSQISPLSPMVDKEHAKESNRVYRGLYIDGIYTWNADCVGAFNILRLYFHKQKIPMRLKPMEISNPYILKVAV